MNEPPISRGFRARKPEGQRDRVPAGQHLVPDFPVLSAGPTPDINLADWRFAVRNGDTLLKEWSWDQFNALPQTEVEVDIHCVTTWSKLDTHWKGVSIDTLLAEAGLAEPPAPYVMLQSEGDYTTNLPSADIIGGKAMVATLYEGKPLDPEHGWPARLVIPHLYFWKSAKWVIGIQFMESDEPGFWEALGYHSYGDPWREQRYAGD
jgi:DMSO/TMAO reductase YedYZ molybdopterin-dependent catalytic subunit